MKKYLKMLREAEESLRFWTHKAMREFTIGVIKRMDDRGTSRAELADALQVSPAYVSKVLRGDVNLTLESMVKLARAVGGRLCVGIIDEKSAVTASNTAVAVAVAGVITHARASIVLGGTVAHGESTRLQLPQGAAMFQWHNQNVGQDDYFRMVA